MIHQNFSVSNIVETFDSSGNTFVSSVDWLISFSGDNSFSIFYSGITSFTEGNSPISNSNEDIINFFYSFFDFDFYQKKAKSLFVENTYDVSYRWLIYELLTIPLFNGVENFVSRVVWRLHAESNNGYSSDLIGQTNFNQLGQGDYVNYNELTQSIVENWLQISNEYDSLKEKLNLEIYDKIYPAVVVLPLPW